MKLAIIPARGGSKRIPRKNIKSFGGRPIIAWSIQAAQDAGIFDRIIVSTDDEEIAAVAQEYGADIPFIRPVDLADDFTGTASVIIHAIKWYIERGFDFEQVCCIYPTAPFIHAEDIRNGSEILRTSGAKFAFSVTSFAFPIQRAIKIRDDGRLEMFHPKEFNSRSQDLTEAYHDAGQFYCGTCDAWLSETTIFSPISVPVMLPRYRVQDIDTLEDWQQAEYLWKVIKSK